VAEEPSLFGVAGSPPDQGNRSAQDRDGGDEQASRPWTEEAAESTIRRAPSGLNARQPHRGSGKAELHGAGVAVPTIAGRRQQADLAGIGQSGPVQPLLQNAGQCQPS